MANNTISQVDVNGTTYDLLDANTLSAVSALDARVTALESSVLPKIIISITTTDTYHPSPDQVSSYPIYENNNYLPDYDCIIDFRIGSKWLGIYSYANSNYKAVLVIGYSGYLLHAWKNTSGWYLSRVYTP